MVFQVWRTGDAEEVFAWRAAVDSVYEYAHEELVNYTPDERVRQRAHSVFSGPNLLNVDELTMEVDEDLLLDSYLNFH